LQKKKRKKRKLGFILNFALGHYYFESNPNILFILERFSETQLTVNRIQNHNPGKNYSLWSEAVVSVVMPSQSKRRKRGRENTNCENGAVKLID
jgi:hypothetical protein